MPSAFTKRPHHGLPSVSRRAALAAAAAVVPAFALRQPAFGAERCVAAFWGGDYARLLKQNVSEPILRQEGVDVVPVIDDEGPRVAELFSQRALPRGTLDVACLQTQNGFDVMKAGLVDAVSTSQVPNLAHVLPALHSGSFMPGYFVPQMWTAQVLVYNPKTVKTPPTGFEDLLDPRWKGKVGMIPQNDFPFMMGAGLVLGGNPGAFGAAKKYALELNRNGLRLYPEVDDMAPAFKSREIDVGITWLARAVMWQNEGIPIRASFPKEGAILFVFGMAVPKNAPNKGVAYKFINAVLEPSAQVGFAKEMGYLPSVNNAQLTGRIAEQLALPANVKLVQPDYAKLVKELPSINEWWVHHIERK